MPTRIFLLRSFSAAIATGDNDSVLSEIFLPSKDADTSSLMLSLEMARVVWEDSTACSTSSSLKLNLHKN